VLGQISGPDSIIIAGHELDEAENIVSLDEKGAIPSNSM
jgi:hypothetical protein